MKFNIYHRVYVDVAEALKRNHGIRGPVGTLDRSLWLMSIYGSAPGQLWSFLSMRDYLNVARRAVRSGAKDQADLVKH